MTIVNRPMHVLLVEDNPGDARLLEEFLSEVASVRFNLTHADCLEKAVAYLNEQSFDVAILDLSLPDSQGLETFIKARTHSPTTPIIVLTGLDDEILAIKAMQEGAQDYLVKGQVNGNMLARSMRYAIERKQAELARQQEIKREKLIIAIAQRIRRSLNLTEILNTTVGEVRQFLQADRVLIYRILSHGVGRTIAESVLPEYPAILGMSFPEEVLPLEYQELYRQGRMRAIEDVKAEDTGLTPCLLEFVEQWCVRAKLTTPILVNDSLWGLLIAHQCSQPRQWRSLEIELMQQLATQLGIAIQQSELYQQVQSELAERRQSEQVIREQAALLNISTDAILVRDLQHRILFWNKGAERLLGWLADEAIGKDANQILYKEISPQLKQALKIVMAEGKWQGELHKVRKDGKEIVVQSRWTLARDAHGHPKSILTVDTDITEKKQLEMQFLRAQRLESLGTLASGIAHDLNNVLAPILAASQLIQAKVRKDDPNRRMLEIIETSAKRGADLVKQVLSFARGVEGDRVHLSVKYLISEIEQIVKQTFPKSIDFSVDIVKNLWDVYGDATQLHQVLINLVVNARDAMPSGGNLSVAAENLFVDESYTRLYIDAQVGRYVAIAIADTGVGIPPDVLERIFEPFFTTKAFGKGTGLGLSTVLGIVKSHGGFINVLSQVGQGTQFKLFLPAVPASKIFPTAEPEFPLGQGELILVVDDEASIRETIEMALTTHNYRIVTANNGIEAIAQYVAHQQEIAVVLMDMMMPTMGGETAIRTLQKMNPQVKIIANSGVASMEALAQTTGNGIRAFLPKPCTTQELLTTIRKVINS
ncbi:response regulator [Pseudanabaena sp. PCC 6802]|uniref:response regulator n=1 Tax=Pseudanabaena sp. PCC 6802 TaxID=118173 RepID=UPI00037FB2BA|nr:response regulator [Pseudanabaena sp. PCC 6802]